MREKQLRLVVTFPTTTAAMAMESACQTAGVPGRLIPVPPAITAGCGMAWSAPPEARARVEQTAKNAGITISGLYELTI